MVKHFAGKFKGRLPQTVPFCKQFAMRPMFGAVTENKAEVDCKACAKALGITAAVRVETGTKTGTCQCCFNAQKLPKGLLSHHGYRAPGHGYHIGQCRGERALPYELSCDVTREFMYEVQAWVDGRVAQKARLEAGEVEKLSFEYEDRTVKYNPYQPRPTIVVWVEKGAGFRTVQNGPTRVVVVPSYEDLRERAIRDVELNIRAGQAQVDFLNKKIAEWKLVEGFEAK